MLKRRERVTIISRESNERTLDVELLEKELCRRGIDVRTLCRLLTKERSLKSLSYIGHVFRQIAYIAGSKVVVLDTYCIPVSMLPHHRGLRVIQMWHALSAVKKFGWQTVGMKDGSSPGTARLMRMHKGYDYVLCASDATARFFCEAFRVTADKIVKLGLPRIDFIKRAADGDLRDELLRRITEEYPELGRHGREIIVYAPTFHRGSPVDVQGLASAIDPDKYDLVVKLHPIDNESSEHAEGPGIYYDDKFTTFEMLSAADRFISDYSSLVVEATLADIPMYLYVYDEDEYRYTTGLNMNFDEEAIGKYVFRDPESLAAAMEEPYDYDALAAFRDKYIQADTENCTGQIADFIEKLLAE